MLISRQPQPSITTGDNNEPASTSGDVLEGQRNSTLFKMAANLKDGRLPKAKALEHLIKFNNEHCKPPAPLIELQAAVRSAYSRKPRVKGTKSADRAKTAPSCSKTHPLAELSSIIHQIEQIPIDVTPGDFPGSLGLGQLMNLPEAVADIIYKTIDERFPGILPSMLGLTSGSLRGWRLRRPRKRQTQNTKGKNWTA